MGKLPHKLFDKVWWSYVPSTWEGFFVFGVYVIAGGVPLGLGIALSEESESRLPLLIGLGVFALVFGWFLRFAKRHS